MSDCPYVRHCALFHLPGHSVGCRGQRTQFVASIPFGVALDCWTYGSPALFNYPFLILYVFPQMLQLEESDKEGSDSDQKESGVGKKSQSKFRKYVPPRLVPVHYGKSSLMCTLYVYML